MTTDPWLVSTRPRPDAPVRLLVFPHAGGSAAGAMAGWGAVTGTFLGATTFPGDHFYLFSQAVALTTDLSRHLCQLTPRD